MSFNLQKWVRSRVAPTARRTPVRRATLVLTACEDRSVPATVGLTGGQLTISGSGELILAGAAGSYTLTDDGVASNDPDLTNPSVTSIQITTNAGNDVIDVSGVTDLGVTISTGTQNDSITGSPQADTLNGGNNADTIYAGGGNDVIINGETTGPAVAEEFYGEDGDDTFRLTGDTVAPLDLYSGGQGNDTIENLGTGASFSLQNTTFSSIETLDGKGKAISGSNSSSDVINLTGVHTLLNVTGANFANQPDTLTTAVVHSGVTTAYLGGNGGVNKDAIAIRLSPAQLVGLSAAGELDDLQNYVAAPSGKTLSLSSLTFTATQFEKASVTIAVGEANYPLPNGVFVGVTNVVTQDGGTIQGTPDSDLLINTGSKAATIIGYGSADVIIGGSGADTIQGGNPGGGNVRGTDGADVVFAGDGDDVIQNSWGEGVNDVIDGGTGTDTVQQMQNTSDPQRFSNFTPANGIERLLNGGSVRGTDGDNVLDLTGVSQWDLIAGARTVMGEDGNDTITLPTITGLGFRAIGGTGNDTITGGDGNDTIDGGAGNDSLFGGSGDDYMRGGSGMNIVSGGAGADTFFLHNIFEGTASQTISDFTDADAGEDKLKFQNMNIAAVNGIVVSGGNTVITFTNGQTLTLLGYTGELDRGTAGDGEAEIIFGTW